MYKRIIFLLIIISVLFCGTIFSELHEPKPNPNPFTKGETIEFLTNYPSYEKVELFIYNTKGDLIIKKIQENFSSSITWDGKNKHGYFVSKGIYFYVLKIKHNTGSTTKTDTVKGTILFVR